MFISNVIRRAAETDTDGRFTFAPLPPGEYSVAPSESNYDGDRKVHWAHRPLPEVFAPTKLTIKEGETPAPLEIRALPSVVIEGHWVDSKGQPKSGWSSFVGGKMDGSSWMAQAHVDPQGRFSLKVPHGLEEASFSIITNEHAATRHRIGKDGPLVEGRRSSSARSTTTSRTSRSSGTSRRSSSSTPPRRTASRSRISRRTSSTPGPARIAARMSTSWAAGRRRTPSRTSSTTDVTGQPTCCPTRR